MIMYSISQLVLIKSVLITESKDNKKSFLITHNSKNEQTSKLTNSLLENSKQNLHKAETELPRLIYNVNSTIDFQIPLKNLQDGTNKFGNSTPVFRDIKTSVDANLNFKHCNSEVFCRLSHFTFSFFMKNDKVSSLLIYDCLHQTKMTKFENQYNLYVSILRKLLSGKSILTTHDCNIVNICSMLAKKTYKELYYFSLVKDLKPKEKEDLIRNFNETISFIFNKGDEFFISQVFDRKILLEKLSIPLELIATRKNIDYVNLQSLKDFKNKIKQYNTYNYVDKNVEVSSKAFCIIQSGDTTNYTDKFIQKTKCNALLDKINNKGYYKTDEQEGNSDMTIYIIVGAIVIKFLISFLIYVCYKKRQKIFKTCTLRKKSRYSYRSTYVDEDDYGFL